MTSLRLSSGRLVGSLLVGLCPVGCLLAASIGAIDPPSGMPGDTVTLTGSFDPAGSHAVALGGIAAGGVVVTDTTLSFTVPAGAASGTISLTENGEETKYPVPFLVSREVSGVLVPPTGISAIGFKVVGGEGESATAVDGSFTSVVSSGKPTLLWVYKPGMPGTFLALVTDSDASVTVDAASTALALAAVNPLVGFRDSAEMDGVRAGIEAHEDFAALVGVIEDAFAGSYDYLDDARLDDPLTALALASTPPEPPAAAASLAFEDVGSGFPEVRLAELSPGGVPNVFDSKIVASPKRGTEFLILENGRTSRPNTVDWTMELFRLSPSQFPNGLSDLLALDGNSLLEPANAVPLQSGYERAELLTANLDVLGKLAGAVFDVVNGVVKERTGLGLDPPKTNQFAIDRHVDEIYLLQSYSGNLPNGLGFQSAVLEAGDPNSQWAFALAGNLLISALDAAGVFADAKSVTGIDSDFIANLNIDLAKTLAVYRGRGDLDFGSFLDLAKAATTSVIKSYYSHLVSEDTVAELAPRAAKAIGKSFDIIGKISSGAQAVERLTGLGFQSTWAVERSLLIVGNPLRPFITGISPTEAKGGQTVTIAGGNFSWDPAELSVAFCDFHSTSGDVAASVPATITRASPTHLDVTVPDAATYRANFANGTSFLCVTKDGEEVFSTNAGDAGVFTMPPPPTITGLEPEVVTSGAVISIVGERFGSEAKVFFDGFTEIGTFQKTADRIVVALPGAAAGEHTLTVKMGDDTSEAFTFEVVRPEDVPRVKPGGVSIQITEMTMTNSPDGQVSLLEALLIANGTLGRPIEQHVEGEPAGISRETDFVFGDDEFGLGGGAAVRDTISSSLGAGVFPISAALPGLAAGDDIDLDGATLDGTGAPGGAFVLDGADDVVLEDVILKNFPGDGIVVSNDTQGAEVQRVTVDGVGGAGVVVDNLCTFNTFTTIEVLNVGGEGLRVSGDSDENLFSSFQIDGTGSHGLRIDGGSDHNQFNSFTIHDCGADGLRLAGGSERNLFGILLEISEMTDAGIRLTGAGTRYNRLAETVTSGSDAVRVLPAVRDCGTQGVAIEEGASYNVVAPRFISNCTGGGVRVSGAATTHNTIEHPYRRFPGDFNPVFFSLIADNGSHGVVLTGGSGQTLVSGINLYNNQGDGVRVDGSSFNSLLSFRSGVQDFIEDTDPVASPSTGASVRLTNASSNNVIGTVIEVVVSNFGSNPTEDFINHFANDLGGGVIIEGDSDRNHVYGTRIGSVGFEDYHGAVGGPGVVLRGGASENRLGGGSDYDEQIFIASCVEAAVVIDGADTTGNELAGLEIGRFPDGVAPERLPALGIHLRNGTRGNQIGVIGPMDKDLSFGPRRESVSVVGARGPGLWLEACGGSVGTDGEMSLPNVVHNCAFNSCETGILISDDAMANVIGGTRGGGPESDGFVNFNDVYTEENNSVSGSTVAGLRFSNMNHASPLLRNVIQNLSISGAFGSLPPSLDLAAGPPDGCGILIDPDCSDVVVGETRNVGISITNSLVGAYIDGSEGNLIRALDLSSFGQMAAGIVVRGGSQNVIGEPGAGANRIRFVGAGSLPSCGIALVDHADENTVQASRIEFGSGVGIGISQSALNLIGGAGRLAGNEILGHTLSGVEIDGNLAVGNRVQGNFVGVARNGALDDPVNGNFGNLEDGVRVTGGASGNLIGGRYEANRAGASVQVSGPVIPVPTPNAITQSGMAGVAIDGSASDGNSILSNSIYGNSGTGIELRSAGNDDLPAPTGSYATGTAAGMVDGSVAVGSRVQVFSDAGEQGEVLIGEALVRTGGAWTATSLAPAPFANITATVTDAVSGATSPFGLMTTPVSTFEVRRAGGGAPIARTTDLLGDVVVQRIALEANGADVRVTGLTFAASGSLDETTGLNSVRLMRDNNADGQVDAGDSLLRGGMAFDADDGMVAFGELGEVIANGETQEWLVVYEPAATPPADGTTFSLSLAESGAVEATTFLPAGLDVTPVNPFPVRSDEFTVGPSGGLEFDTFIATAFPGETDPSIIGRLADPDGDGIINLLEWILGGDPSVMDRAQISPRLVEATGGGLEFTFRRREGLPAGTVTDVTVSEALAGFAPDATVTGVPVVISNGDGTETVTVPVSGPPDKAKVFLRLEVSAP